MRDRSGTPQGCNQPEEYSVEPDGTQFRHAQRTPTTPTNMSVSPLLHAEPLSIHDTETGYTFTLPDGTQVRAHNRKENSSKGFPGYCLYIKLDEGPNKCFGWQPHPFNLKQVKEAILD